MLHEKYNNLSKIKRSSERLCSQLDYLIYTENRVHSQVKIEPKRLWKRQSHNRFADSQAVGDSIYKP